MRDLEKLCDSIEKMNRLEFDKTVAREYGIALKGLTRFFGGDLEKAKVAMAVSGMAAASVDGKFTEGEYRQVNSLIAASTGDHVSFDSAKSYIERTITGKNSNEEFVKMTCAGIASIDVEAAFSYILFLVCICCADGDACRKERKWIKNIYKF